MDHKLLDLACKIAAEHLKPADISAVAAEGREQRVIALVITVAYYSQTLQPFKRHGKHLVGRLRATASCTLISDEAEYTQWLLNNQQDGFKLQRSRDVKA